MNIRPIKNDKDLEKASARVDALLDMNAKAGSKEDQELDILSVLIEDYENRHHPIPPPDIIEAIRFRMAEMDLKQKDIAQMIGGASRISEIMNRKRNPNLKEIAAFYENLRIPLETFVASVERFHSLNLKTGTIKE